VPSESWVLTDRIAGATKQQVGLMMFPELLRSTLARKPGDLGCGAVVEWGMIRAGGCESRF
jgi:hypothetical protein